MNAPLPEIHLWQHAQHEPELPLATDGVLRYVWHSRFGDMLLEVRDGRVFVNGKAVEPALPPAMSPALLPASQPALMPALLPTMPPSLPADPAPPISRSTQLAQPNKPNWSAKSASRPSP